MSEDAHNLNGSALNAAEGNDIKHDPDLDIDGCNVTNGDRAEWAEWALRTFAKYTGQDADMKSGICVDEHIKDLITDSCHLAHREGATLSEIEELMRNAHETFLDEIGRGEYPLTVAKISL